MDYPALIITYVILALLSMGLPRAQIKYRVITLCLPAIVIPLSALISLLIWVISFNWFVATLSIFVVTSIGYRVKQGYDAGEYVYRGRYYNPNRKQY